MIRINLAVRKQATYLGSQATKSGILAMSGKSTSFEALRMFGSESGGNALKRIIVPIVLGVVLHFGSNFYMEQETDRMRDEKSQLEGDRTKIQDELKRIKGFESVKAELERNELILKTKITTIEKLIRGRDFTLKSLVALTQSLPTEVWMSDVSATDLAYTLRGSTTDIGLISDMMTKLGKSIYFKDVTLRSSSAEANGKIANFELTARKE